MTRRGWYNHSREHAMAAKGIRSKGRRVVEPMSTWSLLRNLPDAVRMERDKTYDGEASEAWSIFFRDGSRIDLAWEEIRHNQRETIEIWDIWAYPRGTGKGRLVIEALKAHADKNEMGLCAIEVTNPDFWEHMHFREERGTYGSVYCYE